MSGSITFLQHIWSNPFNNNEQTVGGGNCIESIFCKAWPDKWLSLTRMEPRLLLYSHRDRRQTSYFPQSNSQGTTENELALINTIQLPLSFSLSLSGAAHTGKWKTHAQILEYTTWCAKPHIIMSCQSYTEGKKGVSFILIYECCGISSYSKLDWLIVNKLNGDWILSFLEILFRGVCTVINFIVWETAVYMHTLKIYFRLST